MPLPIAHALIGASVAELLLPRASIHRLGKVFLIGCLAVAPDLDFILVWGLGLDRDQHRGFSHSLLVAALMGSSAFLWRGRARISEMAVCALAVSTHGILDAITTIEGRGVELLWPFSSARMKFGVIDVWEMQPGWLAAGELGRAMQVSVVELAVLGPLVLGCVCFRRWLAGRGSSR